MKNLIKIEEIAIFGFSIYLFDQTNFNWWWYPALFLAPDISMLGYLIGNKTGAFFYNLFHHKAIALIVLVCGYFMDDQWLIFAGCILFGHASFDRVFDYGLKYQKGFKYTHLGEIGS